MKFNFKDSTILILYQIVFLVGSVYFVSIFTTKVGLVDFGKFSLFMAKSGFFSTIIFGPIVSSVNRFYYDEEYQKNKLAFSFSFKVLIFAIIPFALISILIKNKFYAEIAQSISYAGCLMIFSLYAKYENSLIKRIKFIFFKSIPLVLKFISLLILIFYFPDYSIINNLLLSSIIISFLILFYFYFKPNTLNFKNEFRNQLKIFSYSKSFFLVSLFTWVENFSDRFIVDYYLGESILGSYIAIKQYFYSTFLIGCTLLQQYISPYVYNGFSVFRFFLKYKLYFFIVLVLLITISFLFALRVSDLLLPTMTIDKIALVGFVFSGFVYLIANILYLEVDYHKLIKKTIFIKFFSSLIILIVLIISIFHNTSYMAFSYSFGHLLFLTYIIFLLWPKIKNI